MKNAKRMTYFVIMVLVGVLLGMYVLPPKEEVIVEEDVYSEEIQEPFEVMDEEAIER
tara:strand:- start:335 stop:505 length:171 start_codon:yes stop_codon:yes gene_type:complete